MNKIECTKCKHDIKNEDVIEIFNGELICPRCGSILSVQEFKVTAQNQELFERAELYYGKYLSLCGKKVITKSEEKSIKHFLSGAIEHSRESSLEKHPEARILLGRFWQSGYMEKSESKSLKIAYHYFSNVCYAEKCEIEDDGNLSEIRNNPGYFKLVKRKAALCLMHLLATSQNKLKGKKYNFESNAKALKDKGLITGADINQLKGNISSEGNNSGNDSAIRTTYEATRNKKRCPVFAYFIIPVQDFKRMWGTLFKELNSKKNKELLSSVESFYGPLSKDSLNENFCLKDLCSVVNAMLDSKENLQIDNADAVLLYFYNQNAVIPKHPKELARYLTKRKMDALSKLLNPEKNWESAAMQINAFLECDSYSDHAFFAEDLFFAYKNADDTTEESALNVIRNELIRADQK